MPQNSNGRQGSQDAIVNSDYRFVYLGPGRNKDCPACRRPKILQLVGTLARTAHPALRGNLMPLSGSQLFALPWEETCAPASLSGQSLQSPHGLLSMDERKKLQSVT